MKRTPPGEETEPVDRPLEADGRVGGRVPPELAPARPLSGLSPARRPAAPVDPDGGAVPQRPAAAWSDGELVARCRQGSEAAYGEFVRRFRPRLYAVAARLVDDPHAAEDVVQEAFLAAFRSLERFRPAPSLERWLTAITVRTARKAARRRRARPWLSLDALLGRRAGPATDRPWGGMASWADPPSTEPTADPHQAAEAAELRRLLEAALAELPFPHRAAVVLRDVLGFDYGEAARVMDVPVNTFKSYLLRGRRGLRGRLAGPAEAGREPGGRGRGGGR